jgi:hypothetical protein
MDKLAQIRSGISKGRAQVVAARKELDDLEQAIPEYHPMSSLAGVILGLAKISVEQASAKLDRFEKGLDRHIQKTFLESLQKASVPPQAEPEPLLSSPRAHVDLSVKL